MRACEAGSLSRKHTIDDAQTRIQLHRHFLRLHNGTLVEIIGDEVQYIVSVRLCLEGLAEAKTAGMLA